MATATVLTGVVRDAQGVVQMGVLVQVLAPDSVAIATAFTDQHGRYLFSHLSPGRYRLRATGTLFAPATRARLDVASGARTVADLTLSALLDSASWLPAQRRRPDEAEDDWKWTLRSVANRPILRFDDNEDATQPAGPGSGERVGQAAAAVVEVGGAAGGFAADGDGGTVRLQRTMRNGSVAALRLHLGGEGSAFAVSTMLESHNALGGGSRTVVSYASHPTLAVGSVSGVQCLRVVTAQQAALGESLSVEAGTSMDAVQAGTVLFATHPFLRLRAHPGGNWTVQYRLATARELQAFADVNTSSVAALPEIAVALQAGRPVLTGEQGLHQEVALLHAAGSGTVEVAVYHDSHAQSVLEGVGAGGQGIAGLLTDGSTGAFHTVGGPYTAQGARVTYTLPVTHGILVMTEYSTGGVLRAGNGAAQTLEAAQGGVQARSSQAGLVALRAKAAGTRVRASYRWQPASDVTAVDPFSEMSDEAFLSFFVRQRLRLGSWLPPGLDATVAVSNLLAEGYRPFLSADGRTLYLAQTPRTLQAGIAFNF